LYQYDDAFTKQYLRHNDKLVVVISIRLMHHRPGRTLFMPSVLQNSFRHADLSISGAKAHPIHQVQIGLVMPASARNDAGGERE
jgi:hypothetical protein